MNSENPDAQSSLKCCSHVDHDRCCPDHDLLSPLLIRGIKLRNRIVLSPMCQYSSTDGFAHDWHLVHLGSHAIGGAGLVFTEAAAVTAEGRISPHDLGIWKDEHIDFLSRITRFITQMGSVPAIQIAHSGRKGSCAAPWEGGGNIPVSNGGWDVVGPSPLPFSELSATPHELSLDEIEKIIISFQDAAKRAVKAGFKVLELHAAHGYLLHEFLSPLSNSRTDQYGGSLENRLRLICEVVQAIREVIPQEMPLFVRISATDWVENGWDLNQSIELAKQMSQLGVDLIDTSSGALVPYAQIPAKANYQVPFAAEIRKEAQIMTGAVGLITEVHQANDIITSGAADLVFIGREFLREPYWGIKAEQILNQEARWPIQYGYAVKRKK